MAYRTVDTLIYSDNFIADLDCKGKLFFVYLLTNSKTTQIGVYEFNKRTASFELDIDIEDIEKYIKLFTEKEKITIDNTTDEIMLNNWYRYNFINLNINQIKHVAGEFVKIKSDEIKISLLERFKQTSTSSKTVELINSIHGKNSNVLVNIAKLFPDRINLLLSDLDFKDTPIDSLSNGYDKGMDSLSAEETMAMQGGIAEETTPMDRDIAIQSHNNSIQNNSKHNITTHSSEVHQDELSPKNDYKEFSKQFNVLVEEWNKSEMAMERPITKTTTQMQNNAFKLLQKYNTDIILEVMEHIPSNRWYLGEIPNADGEVFNISFTWFLDINNFEDIMKKLPDYVPY
ncbi:MAG: hypothetical protein WAO56_02395 [Miniphocaeibacter sp.]|uniref:hypothetical protein n=1 Tax=Miniphocaeibacter sp. TaxID=3100973 RepID=UPI003BAF8A07